MREGCRGGMHWFQGLPYGPCGLWHLLLSHRCRSSVSARCGTFFVGQSRRPMPESLPPPHALLDCRWQQASSVYSLHWFPFVNQYTAFASRHVHIIHAACTSLKAAAAPPWSALLCTARSPCTHV